MQVERTAPPVRWLRLPCFGVVSGERLSNTWTSYPAHGDNPGKPGLIPDGLHLPHGNWSKGWTFVLPVREASAAHQLVGEVTAHQGYDG